MLGLREVPSDINIHIVGGVLTRDRTARPPSVVCPLYFRAITLLAFPGFGLENLSNIKDENNRIKKELDILFLVNASLN